MFYKKKPVVVEAFQYDGDLINSEGEFYVPQWAQDAYNKRIIFFDSLTSESAPTELFVETLEGIHHARVGDFIVQGVHGELYPCKPDIFEEIYEIVNSNDM